MTTRCQYMTVDFSLCCLVIFNMTNTCNRKCTWCDFFLTVPCIFKYLKATRLPCCYKRVFLICMRNIPRADAAVRDHECSTCEKVKSLRKATFHGMIKVTTNEFPIRAVQARNDVRSAVRNLWTLGFIKR